MPPKPYIIQPLNAKDDPAGIIGRALWMMEDCRRRTRDMLSGIASGALDWQPDANENAHTIGSLMYHIAAIEISWLGIDVMEGAAPEAIWNWFPHDVRTLDGRLTIVTGNTLQTHWQRLDAVRELLLKTYKAMPLEEYERVRHIENYDVTPEWVLHHLCQHEAEHRFEISALRSAYEKVST